MLSLLDGYKTKIGAVIVILSGVIATLQGVVDADLDGMIRGIQTIGLGIAAFGGRDAIAKLQRG